MRAGGAGRASCAGRAAPACWAGCGPGPGGAGLHRSLRAGAAAGSDRGNGIRGTAGRDGGREGSLLLRVRREEAARTCAVLGVFREGGGAPGRGEARSVKRGAINAQLALN